jgi:glycosyltransferase involved in cell wall biosynthesis
LTVKVALVHDWLTGMRGGEHCLTGLCELYPDADIYTLLHVRGSVSATIEQHRICSSFIQRLPLARTHYRYYLPLFPSAIESFDLSGYDLIVSSSHCVAKGVRVPTGTCHISYIYTPMRYIWDQYEVYFGSGRSPLVRAVMRLLRERLQNWDRKSSSRVHRFVAISEHVAQRVERWYGRRATVVYPPVDWSSFRTFTEHEDFFLIVTAFAPYKRVDLAIQAFNRLGLRLKIIGSGQDMRRLRALAGPTVDLLGWQPDESVRNHYARCRALIFPGEEDFGIVPLEAMSSGKPVIAFGKGGVVETVNPLHGPTRFPNRPPTGIFFYEQTIESLMEALETFEKQSRTFDPNSIRAHVQTFDRPVFKACLREAIEQGFQNFRAGSAC